MLRRLATTLTLLAAMSVGPAHADYVDGDGRDWKLTCNTSGYRLTATHRAPGSKPGSQPERLYLGRGCDAQHTSLGKGTWCWANGGFTAELSRRTIGFPQQELSCPNPDHDVLDCRC